MDAIVDSLQVIRESMPEMDKAMMRESMPLIAKAQQNSGFVVFLKPTQILETDKKRNLLVGKMLLWKEMLEKCIVSEVANSRYG